jgi:hypothetical protein
MIIIIIYLRMPSQWITSPCVIYSIKAKEQFLSPNTNYILFRRLKLRVSTQISTLSGPYTKQTLGKGKAIPLQALTGPEGPRRLRLPDFKTIGT